MNVSDIGNGILADFCLTACRSDNVDLKGRIEAVKRSGELEATKGANFTACANFLESNTRTIESGASLFPIGKMIAKDGDVGEWFPVLAHWQGNGVCCHNILLHTSDEGFQLVHTAWKSNSNIVLHEATVESVIQSNFMRSYRAKEQSYQEWRNIPEGIRALASGVKPGALPSEQVTDDSYLNGKRNEMYQLLRSYCPKEV